MKTKKTWWIKNHRGVIPEDYLQQTEPTMGKIKQETVWVIDGKRFKTKYQAEKYKEYAMRVCQIEDAISRAHCELTGDEQNSFYLEEISCYSIISILAMRPKIFYDILKDWENLEQVDKLDL